MTRPSPAICPSATWKIKNILAWAGAMLLIVGIAPGGLGAEPLSADEGRLARGDVLISFREAPETSVHEVHGEILIDAPPELLWSGLTDYAAYQKIFPSIAGSAPLDRKENIARVKIRIKNLRPSPR